MVGRVNEERIGERVTEAREAAGVTQGDLGAEIGIDRSAVNKIEKGTRRVTAFELSEIARVLKRRMDWFVSDPAPALVARRQREGTSNRTIDAWIERLATEVELVQSLSSKLTLETVDRLAAPTTIDEAEKMAEAVRHLIGAGPTDPIRDLVSAVEQLGLLVFATELGVDSADGACVLLERGGVALVNSSSDVGRRRLTLAHELGHYVIADEYSVDANILTTSDSGKESLLDRFARALLAPKAAITAYWSHQAESDNGLRVAALRAASHYRLDFATLARRLLDLSLISSEEASEIRSIRAGRADYVEQNLHVPTDLEGTVVPRSYELAVINLYRSEKISPERALELTLDVYAEEDLPERSRRTEAEAWQFIS